MIRIDRFAKDGKDRPEENHTIGKKEERKRQNANTCFGISLKSTSRKTDLSLSLSRHRVTGRNEKEEEGKDREIFASSER